MCVRQPDGAAEATGNMRSWGCSFLRKGEGAGLLHGRRFLEGPEDSGIRERLLDAVKFFQEAAPLYNGKHAVKIGPGEENCYFQWKHHFIGHTLEDRVLAEALSGIRSGGGFAWRLRAAAADGCLPWRACR